MKTKMKMEMEKKNHTKQLAEQAKKERRDEI